MSLNNNIRTGDVPISGLIPWLGVGFFTYNFYLEWPHLLGCAGKDQFACVSNQQLTCKPSREPIQFCVINKTECDVVPVDTCVRCQHQCYFLDFRIAIPMDDSFPFIVNLFGATCFYKPNMAYPGTFMFQFCKTVDQLNQAVGYQQPQPQSSITPYNSVPTFTTATTSQPQAYVVIAHTGEK